MTSLDADSLELLEDGLRKAMLSASGPELDAALADLGWADMLSEVPDLAIPSADRRELVVAARTGITRIVVPGRIDHAIGAIDGVIVTATEDGHLLAIIVR